MAVRFRVTMLRLLSAFHNVELADAVFKVAATFPSREMAVGVPRFMEEVRGEKG